MVAQTLKHVSTNLIAREGYSIIAVAIVIGLILCLIGVQIGSYPRMFLIAAGLLIPIFVVYFFRDPHREPPAEAKEGLLVLAPADGKVVLVKELDEHPFFEGKVRQLSIFLSLLDVHVNRVPASGVIEYEAYIPGDYLVAWHPKASEKNERAEFGVRHKTGAGVFFKLIAGAVARRIVYHIKEGDSVSAGDRFGVVKFGSRMDVIVPETIEFEVHVGDTVRAGQTIIARISPSSE